MALKIALDYDGTYDADTVLWDEFMKLAKSRGHEVILTSNRQKADMNDLARVAKIASGLILGKKKEAKENHGIDFDIWIDNGKRGEEDNGKDRSITANPEPEGNGSTEAPEVGVVGSSPGEADERVNAPVEPPKRTRKPRALK